MPALPALDMSQEPHLLLVTLKQYGSFFYLMNIITVIIILDHDDNIIIIPLLSWQH